MKKFAKPVLIGSIGLIVVMLGFSILLPDHVMTSKWVKVSAPKDSVIKTVKDLNTWKDWNLLLQDATSVSVKDSTLQWISPRGTSNSIHIDTVNDKGVSTSITLNNSRPFTSGFSIEKRDPAEDSVQVVWYIIEELKWYPWEKFYGMIAADMKGPLMQASLDKLKGKLQ